MGNTEISDTDTDTDTAETALSVPLPPPAPEIRIPHPTYPLSRVPSPESCWIPNRTAQFAQLCDDNGKHFYCVSTSLSLSFFFPASFFCCSIWYCCCCCCLCRIHIFVAGVCTPLYGFDFNFWAQRQSNSAEIPFFLSPLTRSFLYTTHGFANYATWQTFCRTFVDWRSCLRLGAVSIGKHRKFTADIQ